MNGEPSAPNRLEATPLRFEAGTYTLQKKGASENQDRAKINEGDFAAVLCDGLGGMTDGADAAETVAEAFSQQITKNTLQSGSLDDHTRVFQDAVQEANMALVAKNLDADRTHIQSKSLTTLTALQIVFAKDKNEWYAISRNIGDSRLYVFRQNKLYLLTKDDSMLLSGYPLDVTLESNFDLLSYNELTPEQKAEIREKITQVQNGTLKRENLDRLERAICDNPDVLNVPFLVDITQYSTLMGINDLTREQKEALALKFDGMKSESDLEQLSPLERAIWKERHTMLVACGMAGFKKPEAVRVDETAAGDVFILMSDGISDNLKISEMETVLQENDAETAQEIARALCSEAEKASLDTNRFRPKADDMTALVVKIS